MNIRPFRLVAPAGAPIPACLALSSAFSALRASGGFEEILKVRLRVPHVFLVSSGRATLTILLRALQQISRQREVVIPAYTCFSVPSAIVRAGLSIRLCDIDPKTFDLDHNAVPKLDLGKVLCILSSGLFGLPSDLVTLEEIARDYGTFLIDDAAQCLGATVGERPCGTFGDAGFYSLGRGKNITTMGGGILLTCREDLADLIEEELGKLPRPPSRRVLSSTLNSLLYAIMLPPSRYWLLDRIPFLDLGVSRFDPNFRMSRLSAYQARLAVQVFPLLDSYNRIRRNNAEQVIARIERTEGIEIPQPSQGASPVFLRLPILARDEKHRTRLLRRLTNAGIGATASYPSAIGDIPGISRYLAPDQQPCPGARSVASRILTLPTHPYVTPADVDTMVKIIWENSS